MIRSQEYFDFQLMYIFQTFVGLKKIKFYKQLIIFKRLNQFFNLDLRMFRKSGLKNPWCYGNCVGNFKLERVYTIMSRLVRNNNIQFVILTEDLARGKINFICSVSSELI